MKNPRVLFICKRNETYGFKTMTRRSSGLYNSTSFIVRSLVSKGIDAHIIEVQDNNDIDREVTKFKADIVVIEALWVVPEKFPVLKKLHPKVKWFVHLHSHMPFLALEGIAMEWILAYARQGIGLIANSIPSYKALRAILKRSEIVYLPNVYLPHRMTHHFHSKDVLDIGCFGAVRPLKNQLIQALAAIRFGRSIGKCFNFHINATRVETNGDPILKNLRHLFELEYPKARLIEHPWYDPNEFLNVLEEMDLGMQVSLTETFNVVCADYVTAGIPVVASSEVAWISKSCWAEMDDIDDILRVMHRVWENRWFTWLNRRLLYRHSSEAQCKWFEFVEFNAN